MTETGSSSTPLHDGPLDAFASRPHYLDHLLPIWQALPGGVRGQLRIPKVVLPWAARREAEVVVGDWQTERDRLVLVGGMADAARVHPDSRLVLVEHGAGQTYRGAETPLARHAHYAGGHDRHRVALFVVPSERVAAENRQLYPETPNAVVGCPRLDRWLPARRKARSSPPVVAVTFHYDGLGEPAEARSAWPAYRRLLADFEGPWQLLGHEHPRWESRLLQMFEGRGWETTADPDEVFDRADLLVADNTSLLYEFAALDRPVVCLDAPWYRREVEHGLRFWSLLPGQSASPETLGPAIRVALLDPPELQRRRRQAAAAAYRYRDGRSSERAARAVCALLDGVPSERSAPL